MTLPIKQGITCYRINSYLIRLKPTWLAFVRRGFCAAGFWSTFGQWSPYSNAVVPKIEVNHSTKPGLDVMKKLAACISVFFLAGCGQLQSSDQTRSTIAARYQVVADSASIGAHVVVGKHAEIGARVRLHPNVTIYDNVSIGADSEIHAGVAIRENSVLGERVIVHNNTVIGSDGFGIAKAEERRWLKIPQTGRVVIEDDVEIGAGTTIDKASTGETRVKRGAKLDNLVQVGHSCEVGEDALLCAQVGMAGSSRVGDRVILTGQVGIGGHITVGDDAILYPQSGVPNDVAAGAVLVGTPAFEVSAFWRAIAVFKKLGDIPKRMRGLEKRLDEIEKSKSQQ